MSIVGQPHEVVGMFFADRPRHQGYRDTDTIYEVYEDYAIVDYVRASSCHPWQLQD